MNISAQRLEGIQYLTWKTTLSNEQEHASAKYSEPTTWRKSSKMTIYGISVLTTFMAAYSISAYVAGADAMAAEFQSTNTVVLIGMTTFQTGFAIGPMVLAPLSELNGRKPVFLATYALFNGMSSAQLRNRAPGYLTLKSPACTLIIALIKNLPALLVVRFLQGVGASTFSTMVSARYIQAMLQG